MGDEGLPKSTLAKAIKEMLPEDMRIAGDAVDALNTIFAAAVALTRLSAPSLYTHRKKPILYRSTGTLNQGIELHVKEVYRTCSILVSKW